MILYLDKSMRYRDYNFRGRKALTLLEMVIAMAIITVLFSSVLPLFRNVQAGWDARREGTEKVQNGRFLMEHIKRNLSTAVKITAARDPSHDYGYIEYLATDAVTYRYEMDTATKYVTFGAVGDLSQLAGPVSSLKFTCYEVSQTNNDLSAPIADLVADVELTRFVEVAAVMTNPEKSGIEKEFKTSVYFPANGGSSAPLYREPNSSLELDLALCADPAVMQIDSTHYLCVYSGPGEDGWAVVLEVDTDDWTVSKSTPFEFDGGTGATPALSKIGTYKYLCAYTSGASKGYAVMLTVSPLDWTITKGTAHNFDGQGGTTPSLFRINNTHHLCVYEGKKSDGFAVVLTVNESTGEINAETPLEFDTSDCYAPALSQVDTTHYLCVYEGSLKKGVAVILTVNTTFWNISAETPFEYDSISAIVPAIGRIDAGHYLCTYAGLANKGYAVVLTVNTGTWRVTSGIPLVYNLNTGWTPDLGWIEDGTFLCAYEGPSLDAWANVLTVDTDDWTVGTSTIFEYDPVAGATPSLARIDTDHYLCVYQGDNNDGWACILNVNPPILP